MARIASIKNSMLRYFDVAPADALDLSELVAAATATKDKHQFQSDHTRDLIKKFTINFFENINMETCEKLYRHNCNSTAMRAAPFWNKENIFTQSQSLTDRDRVLLYPKALLLAGIFFFQLLLSFLSFGKY